MIDTTLMAAILDSLKAPVLFGDTQHVTRYMNRAAVAFYEGGESLIGQSLLECHNEQSQQMMIDILAAMQAGQIDEQLITESLIIDNQERQVYMRAVRDSGGQLQGYYERYEPKVT